MTSELQTITQNTVNPAAAYLASLNGKVSRDGMRSELTKVALTMGAVTYLGVDWSTLNAANVAAILGKLQGSITHRTGKPPSPASMNKTRAAIRGVAKAAWRLNLISSDELARINDVKGNPGTREIAGRDVSGGEIVALMQACADDPTPAGARDAAMIAIAKGTGCRRAELAGMLYETLTIDADGALAHVKIIGKRNKQRTLHITNGALSALKDWVAIRGQEPGPMFYAINRGGAIQVGHGLTPTALDSILVKRAAEGGVDDCDWHDLRRTVAGELLDAGVDIVTVAGMLGHSSVTTTARYDRRGERTKAAAAAKISVPYFGRRQPKLIK